MWTADLFVGNISLMDFSFLFSAGGRVILACRDLKSAYSTRDEIVETTYNKNVVVKQLDLSSLQSISDFAKDVIHSQYKYRQSRK